MRSLLLLFVLILSVLSRHHNAPVGMIAPRNIDTSIVLHTDNGTMLHFPDYFKLLYEGEHYVDISKGNWYLRKYPDSTLKYIHLYRNRLDSASRVKNIFQRLIRADKVLVIKSTRRLYIQRNGKNLFNFPVNLGKNPVGHKLSEGDGRTPEGNYTLDTKFWEAKYHANFHISYPDSNDVKRSGLNKVKVGGDVMIHGTSVQRTGLKDWTNGCIALSNAQIDTLFKYVGVGTLIEIRK